MGKTNALERIFPRSGKWFNGERKEVNPKSIADEPKIILLKADIETVRDKIRKINEMGITLGANYYCEGSSRFNKGYFYVPVNFYKI